MISVTAIEPIKTVETTSHKAGWGSAGTGSLDGGRKIVTPIALRAVRVMLGAIGDAVRTLSNPKAIAVFMKRFASLPFEQLAKGIAEQSRAADHGKEDGKGVGLPGKAHRKYSGLKGIKYV